jgi:hypothetical protein
MSIGVLHKLFVNIRHFGNGGIPHEVNIFCNPFKRQVLHRLNCWGEMIVRKYAR